MIGRVRSRGPVEYVEVRVLIPVEAYEDLKQMAKVSGLAVSQYLRSLFMTFRAKMYATKDNA